MLPNIFRDAFSKANFERPDELINMFQIEYPREYKQLRQMGTPITKNLVKEFLRTKNL